jgi:hypothetical protein
MEKYVEKETRVKDKPEGLLWESNDLSQPFRIWVKTWGQIIHDCKTRLKIFQQALNITADKDAALDYLRKTYERILHGADAAPEPDQTTESKQSVEEPASTA